MAVVDHGRPLRRHGFGAPVAFAVAIEGRRGILAGCCLLLRFEGDAPFGSKRVLVDLILGHSLRLEFD